MKNLPTNDFRCTRYVLEPSDFALGSEDPDQPATDLIPEEMWRSIVSLSDDVSIRRSDHFGSKLRQAWSNRSDWNELVLAVQDIVRDSPKSPIAYVTSDAGDEFQASVYCALAGFYRVAFACLRSVTELVTVDLYYELALSGTGFNAWLAGDEECGMGTAADKLLGCSAAWAFETRMRTATGDDLFHPRNSLRSDPGGFARRHFRLLSAYAHSSPGYTDADMRQSNGPIFLPDVVERWICTFYTTFCYGLLLLKLAKPGLSPPQSANSISALYDQCLGQISQGSSDRGLLSRAGELLFRSPLP